MRKIADFFKERWPCYLLMLLGITFSGIVFHIFRDNLLDNDMSSEMILGRLLNERGGIISQDWFYSEEIRVFSIQLVYKYLFFFLNDWHLIRSLAIVVSLVLLMSAYCLFCERLSLGKTGLLCGIFFTVPFCMQYGQFVLFNGGYFPHLIFMFLALSVCWRVKNNYVNLLLLALCALLAFASGISGVRYLLILYIPFLLTALILLLHYKYFGGREAEEGLYAKLKFLASASALSLLSCIFAMLINGRILSKYYSFVNYVNVHQRLHFDLSEIINFAYTSFLEVFGAAYYYNITGDSTFRVIAAWLFSAAVLGAFVYLFGIFGHLKYEHKFIVLFAAIGFVFNVFIDCVSNKAVVRYIMLSLIMCIPCLALLLSYLRKFNRRALFNTAAAVSMAYLALQLAVFCRYPFFHDSGVHSDSSVNGSYHREAAEWLVEHGYMQGFATFWHSNLMTEYSDGDIEMWTLRNGPVFAYLDKEWTDLRVVPWLQYKSHVEKMPEGKVFLLLSSSEAAQDKRHLFTDGKYLIYKNPGLRVYGFDSYKRILANLFGKNLNGMINVYSPEGKPEKSSGERLRLKRRCRASGPKMSLPKGRYILTADCSLSGRRELRGRMRFRAKGKKHTLPLKLHDGINEIPFVLDADSTHWGIDIVNRGKDNAYINRTELMNIGKTGSEKS